MKWLNHKGKEFTFFDKKYLINWSKKAPSKGSQEVKEFLATNYKFWAWYEEYRLPQTRLRVDFLTTTVKLAIEFHGRQHEDYIPFLHGSRSGFLSHIKRDVKKEEILSKNGFKLIEIYEDDLELLSRSWFEEKMRN